MKPAPVSEYVRYLWGLRDITSMNTFSVIRNLGYVECIKIFCLKILWMTRNTE